MIIRRSLRHFATKASAASSGPEVSEAPFSEKFNQLFDKFKQTPMRSSVNLADVVPPPKFYANVCS